MTTTKEHGMEQMTTDGGAVVHRSEVGRLAGEELARRGVPATPGTQLGMDVEGAGASRADGQGSLLAVGPSFTAGGAVRVRYAAAEWTGNADRFHGARRELVPMGGGRVLFEGSADLADLWWRAEAAEPGTRVCVAPLE